MQRMTQRAFTCATLALTALVMGCAQPAKLTPEEQAWNEREAVREARDAPLRAREAAIRKSQETPTIGVGLECVRHGGPQQDLMPYVQGFWVQEVPYGQVSPEMSGGDFNCGGTIAGGYTIPRTWRPGMKVKVKWYTWDRPKPTTITIPVEDDPTIAPGVPIVERGVKGALHEYTTTIPYYPEPGRAYVHLFRNGQARVIISNIGPTGRDHPLPFSALEPPPEVE
ncbi:DUF3304 domain-containing protein [Rhodoferax aquaticus]|nr:DUF3304 domain-containing protein [Rhodoferax aquaticus]